MPEHYAPWARSFWRDRDVKGKLSRDEKLLLFYFGTSPHGNISGLYYCPLSYAAAEAEIPEPDVKRAVQGALAKFLTYDFETEEVFVHGAAKRHIGETMKLTDNRRGAILTQLDSLQSTKLRRAFLLRYNEPFGLGRPLPDSREATVEPLERGSEGASEGEPMHIGKRREENIRKEKTSPRKKRAAAEKAARETWLTPFVNLWAARVGSPPATYGRFARYLAVVTEAVGAAVALERWERYLAATDPQYASPARFADTHGHYSEPEPAERSPFMSREELDALPLDPSWALRRVPPSEGSNVH